MKPPAWLTVGTMIKPQGLQGEVRVKSKTDFPERRFAAGKRLMLQQTDVSDQRELTIENSRFHKGIFIIKFRELNAIEEVEPLRGAELKIPIKQAHELEKNAYYFYEIIGCEVMTTAGEQIGTVKEILQPGANDVWVVERDKTGKELYLPYIPDVVKSVLPAEKRVIIEWLDGLE